MVACSPAPNGGDCSTGIAAAADLLENSSGVYKVFFTGQPALQHTIQLEGVRSTNCRCSQVYAFDKMPFDGNLVTDWLVPF